MVREEWTVRRDIIKQSIAFSTNHINEYNPLNDAGNMAENNRIDMFKIFEFISLKSDEN